MTGRHCWIAAALVPLCLTVLPAGAAAQASPFSPHELERIVRESAPPPAPPAQASRQSDSVANGVLIGALIGGLAMGLPGGIICKVLQEPGGPSCLVDGLQAAALGAAIGAGAGLAVDAARTRQGGLVVKLTVRYRK
jgi:hypothetical protein